MLPINQPEIDISNLVGYWKFNEGSGNTAADSSNSENNGTLYNTPTWITGKFGGGLSFDGLSQYVDIGNVASLNFGIESFTISFWMNTTVPLGGGGDGDIIVKDNAWVVFISDNGGTMQVNFMDTTINSVSSVLGVNDGIWHFIVAERVVQNNDVILKIWIDGSFQAQYDENASPTTVTNTDNVTFAKPSVQLGNGQYYNGSLDEVRIFNKALSQTEINGLYNYTMISIINKGDRVIFDGETYEITPSDKTIFRRFGDTQLFNYATLNKMTGTPT